MRILAFDIYNDFGMRDAKDDRWRWREREIERDREIATQGGWYKRSPRGGIYVC